MNQTAQIITLASAEMSPFMQGRAWIELDCKNLRHNVRVLRDTLPEGCRLMPAVKCNAYGHGAIEISRELNNMGIRDFCVASASEGIELRKGHIEGKILILGYTHPNDFDLLRRYDLTQTTADYRHAKAMNDYGKRLTVHVKIDTGMNRLGESYKNIKSIIKIFEFNNLDITGIYSHFCAGDITNQSESEYTQSQVNRFESVLNEISNRGYDRPKAHIQNSFGIFGRPDLNYDYARAGIALYGAFKYKDAGSLLPVLSLKARVSAVKNLSAGDMAGYSPSYIAPRKMKIALLSIGYGDGIPRSLSHGAGRVLIKGRSAPVVGLVCMDQMTVDITNIDKVEQGDLATVIGKDGDEEITVFELAELAHSIPNEIFSGLGGRLERIVDDPHTQRQSVRLRPVRQTD